MNNQQHGTYQITTGDDGVYLSVWPPLNGGAVVERFIVAEALALYGFDGIHGKLLTSVIRQAAGVPVKVIDWLPSIDGRYQLTAGDDGIYLSVWSSGGQGAPVELAAVLSDLAKFELVDVDQGFIRTVIREALAMPIQVAKWLPKADGYYKIAIDDESVFLTVVPPVNGGMAVSKYDVVKELRARRCNQFDPKFIAAVVKDAVGVPVQVMSAALDAPSGYDSCSVQQGVSL